MAAQAFIPPCRDYSAGRTQAFRSQWFVSESDAVRYAMREGGGGNAGFDAGEVPIRQNRQRRRESGNARRRRPAGARCAGFFLSTTIFRLQRKRSEGTNNRLGCKL
jgi:hypothetical protein